MSKLVSIIVPVYNAEKYLPECIDSLLSQTYDNIEIILVNDGSKDKSEEVCLSYSSNKKVNYYHKENGGVSSARNYGIKKSKGDYIFFIDADDFVDQNVISQLVKESNDSSKIVSINHICFSNKTKKIIKCHEKYNSEEYILNMLNGKNNGFIWGYLFNASYVKKICFDEKTYYLEDMLFLIDYIRTFSINQVKFVGDAYYNYRLVESSITKNKNNVYNKIDKIVYSLDKINERTSNIYSYQINDKKIRMIESLMRNIKTKSDINEIVNSITINKYSKNKKRYKLFSYLFINKKINILYFYCKLSNIIRKVSR